MPGKVLGNGDIMVVKLTRESDKTRWLRVLGFHLQIYEWVWRGSGKAS